MNAKIRSLLATIVAALAFVWHFREIATVTARTPPGPFPFVPAAITLVACLLALRWWNDAKDQVG